MNTKLVYVLTCAPESTYIEQAYISIYSARYHNPDVNIVLIVDHHTNSLLVGHRADLLNYISEKIVITVPDEYTPMQASRWLKTSVRNLTDGDFLFIDCDTVIISSLAEIDTSNCHIGAVLDCHRLVSDFPDIDRNVLINNARTCGWDFKTLDKYYSSGVMIVKDSQETRSFYTDWHRLWVQSSSFNVNIDQIAFTQANISHDIIAEIDGIWNCIMFERPLFVPEAKIIHFTALDNNSFLFSKRVLEIIKDNGLSEYLISYIINPLHSFFPYLKQDYSFECFRKTLQWLSKSVKEYGENIDRNYDDLVIKTKIGKFIKLLYQKKIYVFPTFIWMIWFSFKKKYK